MLELKNIIKTYQIGDQRHDALRSVSVSFRDNEFVAVLGPSGSGKTTLLNIIGGLDRYTQGDLLINGVSTKQYKDADWDSYRNHAIGFVFQSYNLIPHQTVLANVELALTLAGVSKKERRERAVHVLQQVGLGSHLNKKPNQMSGGQMQRVAIARALINDPDILLADEPTGALDSETSLQIMDLLKEIAKDKLVIMVTHNPELAEKYATRTVRLMDGQITDDTDPCTDHPDVVKTEKHKRVSMSFLTALALSFNNLRTKKGRTLLTAFAGSIGIIGIALILALSTGMNDYIADVQKETMAVYPITINSKTIDTSGFLNYPQIIKGALEEINTSTDRDGVFADFTALKARDMFTSSIIENNLTDFKKYLDDPDSEIAQYLGEQGVIYGYDVRFGVFTYDSDGTLVDTDDKPQKSNAGGFGTMSSFMNGNSFFSMGTEKTGVNFSEMIVGAGGTPISQAILDNYELLAGTWPETAEEVVLIVNRNHTLAVEDLYQLGFITRKQYDDVADAIKDGKDADEIALDYDKILNHTFYLVPACERYALQEDGTFRLKAEGAAVTDEDLLKNAIELHISGIVFASSEDKSTLITTCVGYTGALTDRIIAQTNDAAVVKAQLATPKINVLNGLRFAPATDSEKAEDASAYLSGLGISEKASLYKYMMTSAAPTAAQTPLMDETMMAAMLDRWLASSPDESVLVQFYDQLIGDHSYEDNLNAFGVVSYDAPSYINIYTDTFENKDAIAACIEHYNADQEEESRITYTDYVALLTSSLTTIIDAISYVLVAFVAISLIVSCIMIGIITHISVLERTKEIGILRALGASKSNISQVFNAETFIVGCFAGLLGIGISLAALLPINALIQSLTDIPELGAVLPLQSAAVLVVISIFITMLGGLLPAKKAAKKDPVVALRTE